jgi:hypothetical protein
MVPLIVIAVGVLAAGLISWNVAVLRRFTNDYRFEGQFHGRRYDCVIRFANLDHGMRCFLGADATALFLLAATKRKTSWWGYVRDAHAIFKTDLRIPWTDTAWKEKRIFLSDYVWFEIPSKKIYFYAPKDVGEKLLIDGQRKISSAT